MEVSNEKINEYLAAAEARISEHSFSTKVTVATRSAVSGRYAITHPATPNENFIFATPDVFCQALTDRYQSTEIVPELGTQLSFNEFMEKITSDQQLDPKIYAWGFPVSGAVRKRLELNCVIVPRTGIMPILWAIDAPKEFALLSLLSEAEERRAQNG